MEVPTGRLPEPTLLEEFRSSMLLFGIALATTGGTVVATRLLVRVLG